MKELILLVGPPGAGKSSYSLKNANADIFYVNQDTQGKEGHLNIFKMLIEQGRSIIVDRMNFNKEQRNRYLKPAKEAGYKTKIIVFHVGFEECLKRCNSRQNHPTIKDSETAAKVLNFFYNHYERVSDNEADEVIRLGWDGEKEEGIIVDLDGTLCNIDHRLHFVKGNDKDYENTKFKKDWKSFFEHIPGDKVNEWCRRIIYNFRFAQFGGTNIILCSGRPDDHRKNTEQWLEKNTIYYHNLFMRRRGDHRADDITKEVILDFEILPKYNILFAVDDRSSVINLWRRRGIVALQCARGDF